MAPQQAATAPPAGTPKPAGAQARPMPSNKNAAPSRTAPAAPQNRQQDERARMDAARAKVAEQIGVGESVLVGFTLEELEVLPKALEKLDQIAGQSRTDNLEQKAQERLYAQEKGAELRKTNSMDRSKMQTQDDLQRSIPLMSPKRRVR
jgi:outer membrane protein OmpA-like peptidoglycan-associated protein